MEHWWRRGGQGSVERGSSRIGASLGEEVESDDDKDDKKRDGRERTWEPTSNGANDLGDLQIKEDDESMGRGWERLRGTMENKGVKLTEWYQF